jgi:hypothetical protein
MQSLGLAIQPGGTDRFLLHWSSVVPGAKAAEQRLPGRPKVVERFSSHTVADVEREDDVERQLFEADEVDRLGNTVVEHVEVPCGESAHRNAVLRHQDVDTHGLDPGREGHPRAAGTRGVAGSASSGSNRAQRGEEEKCDASGTTREGHGWCSCRRGFKTSLSRSLASRPCRTK